MTDVSEKEIIELKKEKISKIQKLTNILLDIPNDPIEKYLSSLDEEMSTILNIFFTISVKIIISDFILTSIACVININIVLFSYKHIA